MNVLFIIPARGGSKGLPRKNVYPLAGKPLIAWTIEAAIGAKHRGRVVVSTDDKEIAMVSRKFGAEVIGRPARISQDDSPSESAIEHVLDQLKLTEHLEPDVIVFLQATSPVRHSFDIDNALEIFAKGSFDSVFSAYRQHFVGRWIKTVEGAYKPSNYDPASRPRRQEYPEEWVENGSIYVFTPALFRSAKARIGGRVGIYEMPLWKSLQIDSLEDIPLAEKCVELLMKSGRSADDDCLAGIQGVVLDFDGVLTDNRVWVNQLGEEAVVCNRSDGLGVEILKKMGLKIIVISGEKNPVVAARCRKLAIPCVQGVSDKREYVEHWCKEEGLVREQVAFVGNDLNDLAALKWVGIPIAVLDSCPEVAQVVRVTLSTPGGSGVVHELALRIAKAKGIKV
jgi:YrbI family 3-deoxy-D-manno-octulosonate 8-phosphate phosphatase